MDSANVVSRAKQVKTVFSQKHVTFLADNIAYSAFVSLVPLLLFSLLVVSVLGATLNAVLLADRENAPGRYHGAPDTPRT